MPSISVERSSSAVTTAERSVRRSQIGVYTTHADMTRGTLVSFLLATAIVGEYRGMV